MKRVLIVVLALSMLLVLAGCNRIVSDKPFVDLDSDINEVITATM